MPRRSRGAAELVRVLCVCPQFAPVNSADSHRLRLLLPYFAALGWQAEILAVDPGDVPSPKDPWLAARLPEDVPVHRVNAWTAKGWGMNGLAQRSFMALHRRGVELVREKHFDLVFFTTTEFLLHGLGPLWKRRFGVPFCMDFQDPWVNDYYRLNRDVVPPGGRLKFAIIDRLHRLVERIVVRQCAGFLSVSAAYLHNLDARYGALVARQPRCVAGFPAEPAEQDGLPQRSEPTSTETTRVWRYIGRGGEDMALSAGAFFAAWRTAIDLGLIDANAIRFEAIGTSYDPAGVGPKSFEAAALAESLQAQVLERTERVAYSTMLNLLATSDALVVFGSDDPSYNASKIHPYLLSGKPLLAIFHRESAIVPLIDRAGGGLCISFDAAAGTKAVKSDIVDRWFRQGVSPAAIPLDMREIEHFTAAHQAKRIAAWFERIVTFAKSGATA
jgi:hypothetical protein